MDVLEFKKDFIESIKKAAAVTGEGSCAAFVDNMAEYLIDNLLSDPDPKKIDVLKWLESADPKATYK